MTWLVDGVQGTTAQDLSQSTRAAVGPREPSRMERTLGSEKIFVNASSATNPPTHGERAGASLAILEASDRPACTDQRSRRRSCVPGLLRGTSSRHQFMGARLATA